MVFSLIFGVWINLSTIAYLEDARVGEACIVHFVGSTSKFIKIDQDCNIVALEIAKSVNAEHAYYKEMRGEK